MTTQVTQENINPGRMDDTNLSIKSNKHNHIFEQTQTFWGIIAINKN